MKTRWMTVALLACACGSSSGNGNDAGFSPGSLTGTGGMALTVKDAVFGIDPLYKDVVVIIADRTGLCGLLAGTTLPGDTNGFGLALARWTGSAPADHTTGDYAWIDLSTLSASTPPGNYWSGTYETVNSSCAVTASQDTSSGTVHVSQVGTTSGTHLKLTINSAAFGSSGTLSGNIEATYCAAVISASCGFLRARSPAATE